MFRSVDGKLNRIVRFLAIAGAPFSEENVRSSVSFSNDQLLVVNYRFRRAERRARCNCAGASLRQAAGSGLVYS